MKEIDASTTARMECIFTVIFIQNACATKATATGKKFLHQLFLWAIAIDAIRTIWIFQPSLNNLDSSARINEIKLLASLIALTAQS